MVEKRRRRRPYASFWSKQPCASIALRIPLRKEDIEGPVHAIAMHQQGTARASKHSVTRHAAIVQGQIEPSPINMLERIMASARLVARRRVVPRRYLR